MALADALDAAIRRWPELRSHMTPDHVREIERMLAAAVHGASWDPTRLLEVLLQGEPVDHPAWVALRESATRRTGAVPADLALVAAARLRLAIELSERVEVDQQDPERVEAAAEERLFTAPMTDVRARPRTRDMLVLDRGSERVAPSFQFDTEGSLLPSVAHVNAVLDAADDPWGAASWWLTPHAALHAIPADEVRVGNADDVVAAADAIETLP